MIINKFPFTNNQINRLGGVIVSLLASSAEGRGFDTRPDQTKDIKICICCFSSKLAALKSKGKEEGLKSLKNVFVSSAMSTCGLLVS